MKLKRGIIGVISTVLASTSVYAQADIFSPIKTLASGLGNIVKDSNAVFGLFLILGWILLYSFFYRLLSMKEGWEGTKEAKMISATGAGIVILSLFAADRFNVAFIGSTVSSLFWLVISIIVAVFAFKNGPKMFFSYGEEHPKETGFFTAGLSYFIVQGIFVRFYGEPFIGQVSPLSSAFVFANSIAVLFVAVAAIFMLRDIPIFGDWLKTTGPKLFKRDPTKTAKKYLQECLENFRHKKENLEELLKLLDTKDSKSSDVQKKINEVIKNFRAEGEARDHLRKFIQNLLENANEISKDYPEWDQKAIEDIIEALDLLDESDKKLFERKSKIGDEQVTGFIDAIKLMTGELIDYYNILHEMYNSDIYPALKEQKDLYFEFKKLFGEIVKDIEITQEYLRNIELKKKYEDIFSKYKLEEIQECFGSILGVSAISLVGLIKQIKEEFRAAKTDDDFNIVNEKLIAVKALLEDEDKWKDLISTDDLSKYAKAVKDIISAINAL